MSITIFLNGKKEELKEEMTISKILEARKIRPEVVTVELNEKIIERNNYARTPVKANDKLEFVYYMGGGYAF